MSGTGGRERSSCEGERIGPHFRARFAQVCMGQQRDGTLTQGQSVALRKWVIKLSWAIYVLSGSG